MLDLAKNNYNIIDAFPDLQITFFTGTGLSAINFERLLKLVEKNNLISVKEGKSLYNKYKAESKKIRSENLSKKNKLY